MGSGIAQKSATEGFSVQRVDREEQEGGRERERGPRPPPARG